MPRQARLDSAGTPHHVMIRGIEKRRIVVDERDQKDFVLRLGRLAHETGTSIYAWALMSNHAHILLRSGPQGLGNFMRRFLTGYAVGYNFRTPDPPGEASLSRGIFLTPSRMTRYEIPMVYVTETVHLVSGTDHVNSSRIRSSEGSEPNKPTFKGAVA